MPLESAKIAGLHRALLARTPTAAEEVRFADAGYNAAELRQALIRSDAFVGVTGQRANLLDGAFYGVGQRGAPRIGVLSNCQGPELARWLSITTPATTFGLEVMGYAPERCDSFLAPFQACDWIVVSNLHSEQFQGIRPAELEERFPGRVITIQAINFSGLHPDIVSLGEMNARLTSIMGTHSRLILQGYLRGLAPAGTAALFNADTFARAGYFDRWAVSEQELLRRECDCTVKIGEDLIELCRRKAVMMSENHPSGELYEILARKIARLIGALYSPGDPNVYAVVQNRMPVWPIYDEVAEHHHLPYRTSQVYSIAERVMSRLEFIEVCYADYDRVGREVVERAAAIREVFAY